LRIIEEFWLKDWIEDMVLENNGIVVAGADGTLGALIVSRLAIRGVTLRCRDMARDEPLPLEHTATVINAAGPRARPGLEWPDYFREHLGTSRSIVRAMKPGAHLIHLSSTAVFGARSTHLDSDSPEAPLLFPMPAYAGAKYAAELAVRASCREKGVHLTVLRLSMVYGRGVDSALESLRHLAARGLRLRLTPGSFRQHLLNLDLLIHGLTQACRCGPLGPHPLVLADPFSVTNTDINDAMARIYPKSLPVPMPLDSFRKLSLRWRRLSTSRITMPVASLAVLAINNEFAWQPAFQALGLDPSEFERTRTFDRYLT
jgi:nucleoside-diphosphate-sugar epimerase